MPTINRIPHLQIDPPVGSHRVVCDQTKNRYFKLGLREASFLEDLNGSRTIQELLEDNPQGFSPDQVAALVGWLSDQQLLESEILQSRVTGWYRRTWRWMTRLDSLRVNLFNPDPFLDRHKSMVEWCLSRPALVAYLVLLMLPTVLLLAEPWKISQVLNPVRLTSVRDWIGLYVLFVITNVLHEMAHAVSCKHFGGKVTKIGLMLFFLYPVVYVDVSDSWRFRENRQRVVVAAAGLFAQVILSAIALTIWCLTGLAGLLIYFWTNVLLILVNMFPFVKLDGYWILINVVDEPNLRRKGLKALDSCVRNLFRAWRGAPEKDRPASIFIVAFGLGHAIAVSVFWLTGFVGVFRLAIQMPNVIARAIIICVAAPLICRFVKISWGYLKSLGA